MAKLFANSGDPDQMQRSVASDLGQHCLPITLLRVSRLQWVKIVRISAGPIKFCLTCPALRQISSSAEIIILTTMNKGIRNKTSHQNCTNLLIKSDAM